MRCVLTSVLSVATKRTLHDFAVIAPTVLVVMMVCAASASAQAPPPDGGPGGGTPPPPPVIGMFVGENVLGLPQLYAVDRDGTNLTQLTRLRGGDFAGLAVSDDGSRIVFSHTGDLGDFDQDGSTDNPDLLPEIFAINGDVCWLDGCTPALRRLADAWDEARMDALLLLHPTAFAVGYEGRGDFILGPDGRLRRRREREVAPFVFAGMQILHPRLFAGAPEGAFSLNLLYDRAAERERLWGLRHDGDWFHIGTPAQLADVEDALHHLAVHSVHR